MLLNCYKYMGFSPREWRPKEKDQSSVQFSSVTQSCPILCDPMNRSTPGLHSSKASIFTRPAFFTVQLSLPYMTTGKTVALTRRTFVGKVMSLLFNMLSRLVKIFLPKNKSLLISWLQSPSAVILKPQKLKYVDKKIINLWWIEKTEIFALWVVSDKGEIRKIRVSLQSLFIHISQPPFPYLW